MDFHHKFIVLNKKQKKAKRIPIYVLFILFLLFFFVIFLYLYHRSFSVHTDASIKSDGTVAVKPVIVKKAKVEISQPKHIVNEIEDVAKEEPEVVENEPAKSVDGELFNEDGLDGTSDLVTAVVECSTTKGKLVIDVRSGWAPLGAEHFLKLVQNGLFTDLPFTRVCPHYITQFGAKYNKWANVKNDPELTGSILDDPSLWGKRDMDFGYLFYAGGGKNSRGDELVIALCDKPSCILSRLGKADWEVPIATIRKEGFQTLLDIAESGFPYPKLEMIGQNPKAGGPDLGKVNSDPNYLKEKYPFMEYWQSCTIVRKDVQEIRKLVVDHPLQVLVNSRKYTANKASANMRGSRGKYLSKILQEADGINTTVKMAKHQGLITVTLAIRPGIGDTRNVLNKHSEIVFEIMPEWSPLGAARFEELVQAGHFDGCRFFRVIKKFMAQFGSKGREDTQDWPAIPDEPVLHSNSIGTISFASSGPNTRSSQLFINLVNNKYLDKEKFTPVARVVTGMDVIANIFDGYGEGGSGDGYDGKGPSQARIVKEGNRYLDKYFPKLTYIEKAHVYKNFE